MKPLSRAVLLPLSRAVLLLGFVIVASALIYIIIINLMYLR